MRIAQPKMKILRSPLLAVASTFFWFSPQAFAWQQSSNARTQVGEPFDATSGSNVASEIFSKEDLAKKPPEGRREASDLAREQVGLFLKGLTNLQAGTNTTLLTTAQQQQDLQSNTAYMLRAGAMSDPNAPTENGSSIKKPLENDAKRAAATQALTHFTSLQKLLSGVNFDLDVGSVFKSSGERKEIAPTGNVRYGLILKEVIPNKNARLQAATGDMTDNEQLMYAGQADVIWTIGPIAENPEANMFNVLPPSELQKANQSKPGATLAEGMNSISGKFKGKVVPGQPDAATAGDSKTTKAPGLLLTLTQEQNLYELAYQTKNGIEPDSLNHQFTAPIVGTLAIGRRYDDKLRVVRTSVFNVLVDKRAPSVSMHYLDLEQRYQATAGYSGKDYSVAVNADTPTGWKPGHDFGTKSGEKYTLDYNKIF